jgi:hypothetical protein
MSWTDVTVHGQGARMRGVQAVGTDWRPSEYRQGKFAKAEWPHDARSARG